MSLKRPLTELSDQELLDELRELRARRAISMESKRGPRKGKVKPEDDFEALFGDITEVTDDTIIDDTIPDIAESEETND